MQVVSISGKASLFQALSVYSTASSSLPFAGCFEAANYVNPPISRISSPHDHIAPTPFDQLINPQAFGTVLSLLSRPLVPNLLFSLSAMTAVVAPHHAGLWHSRSDHSIHIPNMNMSGLVSSYDSSSRTSTLPPTSRGYQATTSHMDMTMPLFSPHPMTTSMPYQSGAFAFDALSVNPYNMQQAFPSYPQSISHAVSYAGPTNIQQLPTTRDIPNGFSMERSPPVKAESSSPVQSSPIYNETSYGGDFKRANSEPEDGSNNNFATDVDTLMRAIQAKQKPAPVQQQRPQPSKVRQISHVVPLVIRDSLSAQEEEGIKSSQKSKKRYQCSMPDCHKSFYQKTHLEIHTRAHTGVKPFVCISCTLFITLLT
jgi:hypothetical protein